ncbi:RNA-binding protein 27-like [Zophobas morio]|uniref:RNA-binding protein 27-like n=1 Tax=Zophobas morio TaxID=2755281 RepID=UPI0030826EA1
MLVEDTGALTHWLLDYFRNYGVPDPDGLCSYTVALIQQTDESSIRDVCKAELKVFLSFDTEKFVSKLWDEQLKVNSELYIGENENNIISVKDLKPSTDVYSSFKSELLEQDGGGQLISNSSKAGKRIQSVTMNTITPFRKLNPSHSALDTYNTRRYTSSIYENYRNEGKDYYGSYSKARARVRGNKRSFSDSCYGRRNLVRHKSSLDQFNKEKPVIAPYKRDTNSPRSVLSLEVVKIPPFLNTVENLFDHFKNFGTITNIQCCYGNHLQVAKVTFSNENEAAAAHACADPVLNNRFIKVFFAPVTKEELTDRHKKKQLLTAIDLYHKGSIRFNNQKYAKRGLKIERNKQILEMHKRKEALLSENLEQQQKLLQKLEAEKKSLSSSSKALIKSQLTVLAQSYNQLMGPLPSLDFVSRPETPGAPALLSKEGLLDKRDEELKQEMGFEISDEGEE